MSGTAPRETPHVGICWLVQTPNGEMTLLAAGCRDKAVDPALRALVRSYEYEDWPRGRIVFDRARDLFILYADRKLMTPAIIARIKAQFHLPAGRTVTRHALATD